MTSPPSPTDPVPLLKAMIACRSVTPEADGVLDIVAEPLARMGFAIERKQFSGDGSYPVDNLLATRGSGGKHLLFAGHTDVVPPGEAASWRHDPFAAAIEDGHVWGRGAVDMKSGIACFVAALARLDQEGGLETGRVTLAITNDEEADAVNGTEKLLAHAHASGQRFDFAIVGEPSSVSQVGDAIKIGRRGSLNGWVTVRGRQGHVAYPERAINPLPVLAAVATALGEPLDPGTERFPPSNLELTSIDTGNPATNIIPAEARLRFNIRFNDLWDEARLRALIETRLASVDARGAEIDFTVAGRVNRCFVSPVDGSVDLLGAVIAAETGTPPMLSTAGGTSDARFIAGYCPVVECGLTGGTMHQVDERVALAELEALTRLYATFLRRFLSGD